MELLLTAEQAAQIANVHVETIRRNARNGTLRSVKIGRALRIPESALRDRTGAQTPTINEDKAA